MADHRVQRVGAAVHQHRGHPADRGPQQRAPPARRRCSRRPIPAPPGPARPRRARPGRVRTATATAAGRPRRRRRPAGRPSAGRCALNDVPPSATNVVAAVATAVHPGPRRRGGPLDGDTEHAERPEQCPGVQRPGAAGIGVGQPLQSRCAAAEQRHRVPATRIAEQHVGEVAGRDPRSPAPTCWRKHPGSVSQGGLLGFMRLGPPRAPDPGRRSAEPRRGAAARGERDHAAGVAWRRIRRAGKPGGQRQRVQASVQAGPHHRHLPRRGHPRHRRRSRADPRRGRQGARTGPVDEVKPVVLQRI